MSDLDFQDREILFFDGVCNLCNGAITFILNHEKDHELLFAPLQSTAGQKVSAKLTSKIDSLILLERGQLHIRSDAALKVAKHLRQPYSWLQYLRFLPRWLRDIGYDLVARNRYRLFGKKEVCMVPNPSLKARFL
jgi:predicted DCC family thiol-disulfide oxidoreductase YuxK